MTTRLAVVVSVIVALAVIAPTTAQDGGEEDHLVDIAYELTVKGERPESNSFMVRFSPCDAYDNCSAGGWPICPGVHVECNVTGSASFAYKPGARVEYEFIRADGSHREVFERGMVTLTRDTTVRAQFNYRDAGGQQDRDYSVPQKLPDTGAGGMAR